MKLIYTLIIFLNVSAHAFTADQHQDLILQDDSTESSTEDSALEDSMLEQMALQQNADQKTVLKSSIRSALKEYREYKKSHGAELAAFKKNTAILKMQLKDPSSEISKAISIRNKICADTPEICQQATGRLVKPKMDAILNPRSVAWLDYFLPSAHAESDPLSGYCSPNDWNNFHAVLYGVLSFDSCHHGYQVTIQTFGPGLFAGVSGILFACASDGENKINVGLMGGAAILIGTEMGVFFGGNGMCSVLGYTGPGVGAYAGIGTFTIH